MFILVTFAHSTWSAVVPQCKFVGRMEGGKEGSKHVVCLPGPPLAPLLLAPLLCFTCLFIFLLFEMIQLAYSFACCEDSRSDLRCIGHIAGVPKDYISLRSSLITLSLLPV